MKIGVVGINHRLADLRLREALARTCQHRFGEGRIFHPGHHFVLLSTCNRTEVYFCSPHLAETHSYIIHLLRHSVQEDFDQKLYSFFGSDCFLHLCRVTAGLDSAIVAETEIQGQVKIAYEKAIASQSIPCDLHFLFQKSLQIGKKVRSQLPLQRGIPDLEHAILNAATQTAELEIHDLKKTAILFVGASDINLKILQFLKLKGFENITLCNRTQKIAEEYGRLHHVNHIPWTQFHRWIDYDWIITGTKAQEPLIHAGNLPKEIPGKKILFDLSVPRNVDPNILPSPQITLHNIDQLNALLKNRREKMNDTLQTAEQLVANSSETCQFLFREKERARQLMLSSSCHIA